MLAVVAIAVALLIQAFLVKPYRIPSESMENTLLIGDRVLVDRISWRFSDPSAAGHRRLPPAVRRPRAHQAHHRHARRRDLAQGRGRVRRTASKLDEPYVRKVDGEAVPSEPFDNGLPWSLQQPYTVPAGNYFVMGDNRIDSGDSREFGPVPRGQLVGKAFARYWPPGRIGGVD